MQKDDMCVIISSTTHNYSGMSNTSAGENYQKSTRWSAHGVICSPDLTPTTHDGFKKHIKSNSLRFNKIKLMFPTTAYNFITDCRANEALSTASLNFLAAFFEQPLTRRPGSSRSLSWRPHLHHTVLMCADLLDTWVRMSTCIEWGNHCPIEFQ